MSYNGWANWETWNLNLTFDDGETFEELVQDAGNVWDGADAIKDYVESYLDDLMHKNPLGGTIFEDFINASLQEVNWREIAEHHKPDEWGDSDEAPEDEDEPEEENED